MKISFRSFCLSAALAGCALSAAADEPAARSGFAAGPRIPTNVGFASNLSPDKRAMTVIFDNMYVAVEPVGKAAASGTVSGQTATVTKFATIEAPYSSDGKPVRMTLDVRGYATADRARVRLVVLAGHEAAAVSLPADAKKAKKVDLKGKCKQAALDATKPEASPKGGDFQERIYLELAPEAAKPVCQVSLFLFVEHDTDKEGSGGALLAVDSLDLAFVDKSKGEYKDK